MKMTSSERLSLLIHTEKLKIPFPEQRTSIKANRWKTLKVGELTLEFQKLKH
jgi:hypothetical protein